MNNYGLYLNGFKITSIYLHWTSEIFMVFLWTWTYEKRSFGNPLPQTNKAITTPKKFILVWPFITSIGLPAFSNYLFSEIASTKMFGRVPNTHCELPFIASISVATLFWCVIIFKPFWCCLARFIGPVLV